jgi:glycosyltransferase involved in cell wall biosynthesis
MVTSPPRERFGLEACFRDSITVFFPAFNDAPSLPGLIERTVETLQRFTDDYEIIVVDDGSTDDSPQVLAGLQRLYAPVLRIITHHRNLGYGAALRTGFLAATKNYITPTATASMTRGS